MGIDKNKEFDQLFREKLHGFEAMPPESVWAGIEASGLNATATTSNWRWWAAASVLALVLSASGYLYFTGEDVDTLDELQKISQHDNSAEDIPIINSDFIHTDDAIVIDEEQMETQVELVKQNSSDQSNLNVIKEEVLQQEDISRIEDMVFEERDIYEKNDLLVEEELIVVEPRENSPKKVNTIEVQQFNEDTFASQNINESIDNTQATQAGKDFFDDDVIEDITAGHLYDKYWVLGLEFSPEWITVPESNSNIESYGIDISAKYFFSKWFVETGLGIAFSKDDGVYKVDYQDALFKGSYEDVYNVTFDTTGGIITPTYYTKTVNIYDTIEKVSVEEVKNKYVYLNIPLNIGYSTSLGKKFSFYAKTGLNASFKIYENIPTPEVSGENVSIIRLTPLYYQRTDWNLQVQLNLGINYHISDKLLFGLEPNARYYLKSLVEGNEAGNPYGLGVKIGFKYILK